MFLFHFRSCFKLSLTVFEWESIWAFVPMSLSILGIMATLFVAVVMVIHNDTPTVKASGRELCCMILTGCILCYCNTFLLISKPSFITCGAQRLLLGTSFSMIYAPLLTKTNRIHRIFTSPQTFPTGLRWISPESQLIITSLMVAIQLKTSLIWIVFQPPGTRLEYSANFDQVFRFFGDLKALTFKNLEKSSIQNANANHYWNCGTIHSKNGSTSS